MRTIDSEKYFKNEDEKRRHYNIFHAHSLWPKNVQTRVSCTCTGTVLDVNRREHYSTLSPVTWSAAPASLGPQPAALINRSYTFYQKTRNMPSPTNGHPWKYACCATKEEGKQKAFNHPLKAHIGSKTTFLFVIHSLNLSLLTVHIHKYVVSLSYFWSPSPFNMWGSYLFR